MPIRRVNVDGLGRLPVFCHAVVAGDYIHVSGMLGVRDGESSVVHGGVAAETAQALTNIERILDACGATFGDVVKVNVYLTDMSRFGEMNEAYFERLGDDPPARITVGCTALALGARVEIDCVAYVPA
jgi:2-iminobutanoate/2-iminopropanoate deaminase